MDDGSHRPAHLPLDLLRPFPADKLKTWKVGKAVGNARNNDPSLIEALKNDDSGSLLPLFG